MSTVIEDESKTFGFLNIQRPYQLQTIVRHYESNYLGDNWVWLMVNYKDNCIYLSIPSNEVTVTHCLQIPRRVTYLDFTSLSIFFRNGIIS